jgi:hypothetical protein
MLNLDSSRWRELSHVYGAAGDVPELLRRLEVDPSGEVWERLWSCLSHQGSVYPASYAAVPHVVRIAEKLPISKQTMHWVLVGSIARGSLQGMRSLAPEDLKSDFEASLAQAGPSVLRILKEKPGDEGKVLHLLKALVSIRGCGELADILEGVLDKELETTCPDCDVPLYVHVQDENIYISTQEPGGHPDPDRTFIEGKSEKLHQADVRLEDVVPGNGESWLPGLAEKSGESALAGRLSALYGKATCPDCGRVFVVMDELCRPSEDLL